MDETNEFGNPKPNNALDDLKEGQLPPVTVGVECKLTQGDL